VESGDVQTTTNETWSMELGMEFFRLFLLGVCIGIILNVLWIIYYQIPRMMRKIVDLEDNYKGLYNYTWDLNRRAYGRYEDLLKKHIKESHARDY